jgi:Skp family chaperone for outer membrane proteins
MAMRKASYVLMGALAIVALGLVGNWVSADQKKPTPEKKLDKAEVNVDPSKSRLKVGVVNLTKVIKDFKKANAIGDKILATAKMNELELKAEQEQLAAEEKRVAALPDGDEKKEAAKRQRENRETLTVKEAEYQKEIGKQRDDMAIEVNKHIQDSIEKIARRRSLELVLTCPFVEGKEEIGSLADAMRRIRAPAVWVAWNHSDLDMTDDLISTLNREFPPPADK